MKMKTNLYLFIIFIIAISIISRIYSKNVLLLSNLTTSNAKKCFLKNLIQSFKLKKLEKTVLPIENISGGKIGDNNVIFFDVTSLKNNHTENSILLNELQSNLIFHYNTTTFDSILLFYALNDKVPTIEKDIETLVSNFGKNILNTTAIVAINQRRLLNNKKTFLDVITDKYNLSYIHISKLCGDKLDNDIIIKDFNFVFRKTISYDIKENQISNEAKKPKSVYFILVMVILSLILYARRFFKIKKNKLAKNEQTMEDIMKNTELEEVENIEEETPFELEENEINSQLGEGKKEENESVNSNEVVECQLNKDKIKKEIAEIFHNLQIELFDEEEQKEENSLSLTQPKQDNIEIEEWNADKEVMQEPDIEDIDSIHRSDSEGKIEIETNVKLIEGARGEKDLQTTKNDWEILN